MDHAPVVRQGARVKSVGAMSANWGCFSTTGPVTHPSLGRTEKRIPTRITGVDATSVVRPIENTIENAVSVFVKGAMPTSPPSVCSVCQKRACTEHQRQDFRPQSNARGYDATWRRVRAMKLAAQPLCEHCTKEGRVTEATEVHHRFPIATHPLLRLDMSNLESICRNCHMIEEGKRRRRP
jgi:5-methylcytosine-specific restriction protein A